MKDEFASQVPQERILMAKGLNAEARLELIDYFSKERETLSDSSLRFVEFLSDENAFFSKIFCFIFNRFQKLSLEEDCKLLLVELVKQCVKQNMRLYHEYDSNKLQSLGNLERRLSDALHRVFLNLTPKQAAVAVPHALTRHTEFQQLFILDEFYRDLTPTQVQAVFPEILRLGQSKKSKTQAKALIVLAEIAPKLEFAQIRESLFEIFDLYDSEDEDYTTWLLKIINDIALNLKPDQAHALFPEILQGVCADAIHRQRFALEMLHALWPSLIEQQIDDEFYQTIFQNIIGLCGMDDEEIQQAAVKTICKIALHLRDDQVNQLTPTQMKKAFDTAIKLCRGYKVVQKSFARASAEILAHFTPEQANEEFMKMLGDCNSSDMETQSRACAVLPVIASRLKLTSDQMKEVIFKITTDYFNVDRISKPVLETLEQLFLNADPCSDTQCIAKALLPKVFEVCKTKKKVYSKTEGDAALKALSALYQHALPNHLKKWTQEPLLQSILQACGSSDGEVQKSAWIVLNEIANSISNESDPSDPFEIIVSKLDSFNTKEQKSLLKTFSKIFQELKFNDDQLRKLFSQLMKLLDSNKEYDKKSIRRIQITLALVGKIFKFQMLDQINDQLPVITDTFIPLRRYGQKKEAFEFLLDLALHLIRKGRKRDAHFVTDEIIRLNSGGDWFNCEAALTCLDKIFEELSFSRLQVEMILPDILSQCNRCISEVRLTPFSLLDKVFPHLTPFQRKVSLSHFASLSMPYDWICSKSNIQLIKIFGNFFIHARREASESKVDTRRENLESSAQMIFSKIMERLCSENQQIKEAAWQVLVDILPHASPLQKECMLYAIIDLCETGHYEYPFNVFMKRDRYSTTHPYENQLMGWKVCGNIFAHLTSKETEIALRMILKAFDSCGESIQITGGLECLIKIFLNSMENKAMSTAETVFLKIIGIGNSKDQEKQARTLFALNEISKHLNFTEAQLEIIIPFVMPLRRQGSESIRIAAYDLISSLWPYSSSFFEDYRRLESTDEKAVSENPSRAKMLFSFPPRSKLLTAPLPIESDATQNLEPVKESSVPRPF